MINYFTLKKLKMIAMLHCDARVPLSEIIFVVGTTAGRLLLHWATGAELCTSSQFLPTANASTIH
jgi:hypothetical protein